MGNLPGIRPIVTRTLAYTSKGWFRIIGGTCLSGGVVNHIAEEDRFMARTTKKSPTRKHGPTVRARSVSRLRPSRRVLVLVATRKGAWLFHGDTKRSTWRIDGPHFLGHIVNHLVLDPRDGRTLLAAAKTGHLGPTVFRSTDFGRSWKEATRPPAFAKAADNEKG